MKKKTEYSIESYIYEITIYTRIIVYALRCCTTYLRGHKLYYYVLPCDRHQKKKKKKRHQTTRK